MLDTSPSVTPGSSGARGMNGADRDENDLTAEELLRMWEEGEPVEILQTHVEIEPPCMHRPDAATEDRP